MIVGKDLKEESLGGYFVGGFGGALMEASNIERAQPDELVKMAKQQGLDLNRYQKNQND